MDYRQAGVNLEAGYESVRLMKQFIDGSVDGRAQGFFTALVAFCAIRPHKNIRKFLLVLPDLTEIINSRKIKGGKKKTPFTERYLMRSTISSIKSATRFCCSAFSSLSDFWILYAVSEMLSMSPSMSISL